MCELTETSLKSTYRWEPVFQITAINLRRFFFVDVVVFIIEFLLKCQRQPILPKLSQKLSHFRSCSVILWFLDGVIKVTETFWNVARQTAWIVRQILLLRFHLTQIETFSGKLIKRYWKHFWLGQNKEDIFLEYKFSRKSIEKKKCEMQNFV